MKQLKFNPNKDMKELEKYGFKFDNWIYVYEQNKFTGLRVNPCDRRIGLYNSADIIVEKETLVKVYDLIKADLLIVEEVEE